MKRTITLHVNGEAHRLDVEPHETLLEILRRELGLRGARQTCGLGLCGACTVLLDGRPLSACLLLAPLAAGRRITTVEGLASEAGLHPIQAAFVEKMGFQCSYCTPGMLLTAQALLAENPNPTPEEICEYLAGNLCRCGSYVKIVQAVQLAAEKIGRSGA
ncbi:MAG: (2Fe-2S)-binding protein [Anaerolineae bacterium]